MPIEPPVPTRVLEAVRAVLADLHALGEADPESPLLRGALDLAQRCEQQLAEYTAATSSAVSPDRT